MQFDALSLMRISRRSCLTGLAGLIGSRPAAARPVDAVADYEGATGGHAGFHAENVVSGATTGWRADERFVMCSTFKASLAAAILQRVDRGADGLERRVRFSAADLGDFYAPVARANLAQGSMSVGEMCRGAVERSDNLCANLLLARIGGPAAMTAFWRACGDTVSRLDDPEPVLNWTPPGSDRDTTTPRAMAGTMKRFVLGDVLSAPSRSRLTGWLVGSVTGFDRLRAGLPAGWVVGDKTGNNGEDAAGDLAVAWPHPDRPLIIVAYTRGGRPQAAQVRRLFAGIAEAVARELV
jgi:beta-lactamase class A